MSGNSIIIIGASGHGKVVADIVLKSGENLLGFLDDGTKTGTIVVGYPVLGKVTDWDKYPNTSFIIAIGNAVIRERIAAQMDGASWYTAIHPTAVVSSLETRINEGTVVMAGAVINSGAQVGKHCIINTGAIVEHDNQISDYVHIAVGAKLAGNVHIGQRTWIGIGAILKNNLSICAECLIGAGAVVVNNISEPGTYIGIPARKV